MIIGSLLKPKNICEKASIQNDEVAVEVVKWIPNTLCGLALQSRASYGTQ
jgi:hypothetical protein